VWGCSPTPNPQSGGLGLCIYIPQEAGWLPIGKEDGIAVAYNTHWRERIECNILVGKPEWERPLGRPRCRWEDNI